MRPFAPFLSRVYILSAFALVGLGCDRAPSAEGLKDWTPADHDGEKKAPNTGPKGDAGGAPPLVELTWRNQCQSCHGPAGHGDGPQGAMVKASGSEPRGVAVEDQRRRDRGEHHQGQGQDAQVRPSGRGREGPRRARPVLPWAMKKATA